MRNVEVFDDASALVLAVAERFVTRLTVTRGGRRP